MKTPQEYESVARSIINTFWMTQVLRVARAACKEPLRDDPGAIGMYPPSRSQIDEAVKTLQLVTEPPRGEIMLAVPTVPPPSAAVPAKGARRGRKS